MRRPVQPESAMRGAGGTRADIAPEKNTDGKDGRGAGLGIAGGTKGWGAVTGRPERSYET
jgi:hypothetical protein